MSPIVRPDSVSSGGDWSQVSTSPVAGTTALSSSAFGKWIVCTGTTVNYTVTLPSPTGHAGQTIGFAMAPGLTKRVTLAPNAAETIDGASSRVLWALETALLFTDGTNWFKLAGRARAMVAEIVLTAPTVGGYVPNNSTTAVLCDLSVTDNTGAMADTANHQLNILRPATYQVTPFVTYVNVSAAGSFQAIGLKSGAATLNNGSSYSAAGQYPFDITSQPFALVAGDWVSLFTYQSSGAAQDVYGGQGATGISVVETLDW